MKTCPVCKATVFDDMDTCYGCMHRFGGDDPGLGSGLEGAFDFAVPFEDELWEEYAAQEPRSPAEGKGTGDAGGVARAEAGRWVVRLEVRSESNPDQIWSVELAPPCSSGVRAVDAADRAV